MLCELKQKKCLRPGLFDFTIESPQMAQKARPGMFVHVLCGGETYLRRPISICDVTDGKYVRFIFEVRGKGTAELSKSVVGTHLDILGPLGNGFDTDVKENGEIVLIGGGIGIFPLLNLSKKLSRKPTVMLGFRNAETAVLMREFAAVSKDVFVASDDGSIGHNGFVTDILKSLIDSGKAVAKIYTCGPKPMMRIVADIANANNIECEVSMEERMGCGVGACVTCTVTMRDQTRRRVCKDGPIFSASEVDFDG